MNKKFKKLIYIALIISFLSGCKNRDIDFKKKDIAPESLANLNDKTNQILKDIGKIEKINMEIEVEKESSQKKEDKNKIENEKTENIDSEVSGQVESSIQGENREEEEKQNEKSKEGQTEEDKKKQELKTKWDDIEKATEKSHENWNSYTIELIKKGITNERRVKFEKSLNKMTKAVEAKNILDIYDFGSQSILNLKPFFDLYNDEISGDTNEIKYSIYQYYIKAISGKQKESLIVLKDKEEVINKIRLKVKDNDKKLKDVDKIKFSLESMEKSLEVDSKKLFSIKKDIGIKNLEDLE